MGWGSMFKIYSLQNLKKNPASTVPLSSWWGMPSADLPKTTVPLEASPVW